MALRSKLFAGDPQLEAAAVSNPAHIVPGSRGEHVAKIQRALNILDNAGLTVDGVYGAKTASAVLRFKQKRNIINRSYETQADDIVGIMTMAALDQEMQSRIDPTVIIGRVMFALHDPTPDVRAKAFTATTTAPAIPAASIRAVIRNNPYTASGVNPPIDLPSSVPPTKTYAVDVTVDPPLTGSDDFIELNIINTSADNGTAIVSPQRITRSATVVVTGGAQTKRDNGGKLQIQAKLNGKDIKATSQGFTVCAHPLSFTASFFRDIDGGRVGMIVQDTVASDSGPLSDLNEVEIRELVQRFNRDVPPFQNKDEPPTDYGPVIPPAGQIMADIHAEPMPDQGPKGIADKIQLHIFKCHRCGAVDKVVPISGFDIKHEVFQDPATKKWKHKVTKSGTDIGMFLPGTQTTVKAKAGFTKPRTGTSGDVVSPIHDVKAGQP